MKILKEMLAMGTLAAASLCSVIGAYNTPITIAEKEPVSVERKESENEQKLSGEEYLLEELIGEKPVNVSFGKSEGSLYSPINVRVIEKPFEIERNNYEAKKIEMSSWDLFDGNISFSNPPSYASLASKSIFELAPPRGKTRLAQKLEALGEERGYKEIRKFARRQLKDQFEKLPSMTHSDYEQRRHQIDSIGKVSLVELSDTYTDEIKENLFPERYQNGEHDIPLLNLGPFTLMDSGSFKVEFANLMKEKDKLDEIDIGEKENEPIIKLDKYKLYTDFNISVDPTRSISSGDILDTFRNCDFTIGVDLLSDVLGRKMASLEIEVELRKDEVAGFLNFVVKSWK